MRSNTNLSLFRKEILTGRVEISAAIDRIQLNATFKRISREATSEKRKSSEQRERDNNPK